MENRKKEVYGYLETASKLFCIVVILIFVYLLLKYAFSALVPFIIAYLFSLAIVPVSSATARKTGIPKKLCAAVYLSLVFLSFGALLYWGIRRLVSELSLLAQRAARGEGVLARMAEAISDAVDRISEILGIDGSREELGRVAEKLGDALTSLGESLLTSVGEAVGGAVASLPAFFIGIIVTLVACYYFCMDASEISEGVKRMIPERYRSGIVNIISSVKHAVKRYIRAYLILMALTFAEIFVGLSFLKIDYAFLIALGISFVDILPVLGAGAVLIPWAVCALLIRDMHTGLGLLVLYGVVTIIRQIAEPRVVGTSIGLHPVASLFATYAGLRVFGVVGMITGPAVAFMISEIINRRRACECNAVDASIKHGC